MILCLFKPAGKHVTSIFFDSLFLHITTICRSVLSDLGLRVTEAGCLVEHGLWHPYQLFFFSNVDSLEDQFEKRRQEKKERVAKNEYQRLRNIARNQKGKIKGKGTVSAFGNLMVSHIHVYTSVAGLWAWGTMGTRVTVCWLYWESHVAVMVLSWCVCVSIGMCACVCTL